MEWHSSWWKNVRLRCWLAVICNIKSGISFLFANANTWAKGRIYIYVAFYDELMKEKFWRETKSFFSHQRVNFFCFLLLCNVLVPHILKKVLKHFCTQRFSGENPTNKSCSAICSIKLSASCCSECMQIDNTICGVERLLDVEIALRSIGQPSNTKRSVWMNSSHVNDVAPTSNKCCQSTMCRLIHDNNAEHYQLTLWPNYQ